MTTRTYPTSTTNRNVPKGCFLIAETEVMSGEIKTTYYADDYGDMWKVGDWVSNKPQFAYPFEVCRLTGDTSQMIEFRWQQHFRETKQETKE